MKVDSIKLQADPSVFPVAGQEHADSQGFKVEGPFKGGVLPDFRVWIAPLTIHPSCSVPNLPRDTWCHWERFVSSWSPGGCQGQMQFSLICSALVRQCLTEVIRTIPVLTRVLCGRSICVPRRRNRAGFRPARTLFTFRRRGSMTKWRNCNVLHSCVELTVLTQEHTDPQGFKVEGSIKTGHYSIELQSSCSLLNVTPSAPCRRAWNMLGRVRLGWLRGLERQELFIFPVAHGDSAGLRPTRTDLSSHEGARGESGETAPSCTRCGAHRKCDETQGYSAGC